jgi:serine/threonine-protein kinase
VERVLGVGGMGVVVAARHLQLDTKVAIKFLLPQTLANREIVARFAREARAAVRIANEHVARVFDVGALEDGAPYMVMEYLDGEDLAAWLQKRGPLPAEQVVDFLLQACVAVADAHALGIVHRDLKPANLFAVRRSDGRYLVKVLDFGISKLNDTRASGGAVTHTTALMGSPLYMSPEQMESAKNVDAQTDIWALGVIAYELLAGRPPFMGETITEVVVQVTTRPPPPLRGLRPDVPAGLEAVVMRCLERARERRYGDVGALSRDLLPFGPRGAHIYGERISGIVSSAGIARPELHGPSVVQTAPLPHGSPQAAHAQTGAAMGMTTASARHPSIGVWVAAVAVILVAGVGITWRVLPRGRAAAAPESASTTVTSPASAIPVVGEPPAPPASAPTASSPADVAAAAPVVQGAQPQQASADAGKAPARHDVGPPRPAAAPRTAAAAVPPAPAAPAPNCNPPYTVDAQGNHVFKRECVN